MPNNFATTNAGMNLAQSPVQTIPKQNTFGGALKSLNGLSN
jgi:hypothetical protein